MEKMICYANKPIPGTDGLFFTDSTLREGEASPGVVFTDEEKKEIVRRLARVGVKQVQIAYVGYSEKLKKLSCEICAMDDGMSKVLQTNGMDKDCFAKIDFLVDCNPDTISSGFFITPYSNHGHWNDAVKDEYAQKIQKVVHKIRGYGKNASISLIDATRADERHTLELTKAACQAGANRITIADTVGCATPEAIYEIISRVVDITSKYDALVAIHCHNDFGLCLANTLSGIRAGAKIVCTTVDGLGERCGNASLAEVACALEVLYGVKTGIDLKAMKDLSRYVENASKVKVPINKPLVGDYAFSHKQDVHIAEVIHNPLAFQVMLASEVGNTERVMFGKSSGPNTLKYMSIKRGIEIDEKYYSDILDRLSAMDEGVKGNMISEEQFWAVVDSVKNGKWECPKFRV